MLLGGLYEEEATQLGAYRRFQTWLQVLSCPSSPAQWPSRTPLCAHSPAFEPAHVHLSPLQQAPLWADWRWGCSASPPGPGSMPGLGAGTQLEPEGRRSPAAHETRGWGLGCESAAWRECLLDRDWSGHRSVFRAVRQSVTAGEGLMTQVVGSGAVVRSLLLCCCEARLLERSGQKKCGYLGGLDRGLMQTTPRYSLRLKGRRTVKPQESTPLQASLWTSYCWLGSRSPCRHPELWCRGSGPGCESWESHPTWRWSQSWGWEQGCSLVLLSAPGSQTPPLTVALWWGCERSPDWRPAGWSWRCTTKRDGRPPAGEAGCCFAGENLSHLFIREVRINNLCVQRDKRHVSIHKNLFKDTESIYCWTYEYWGLQLYTLHLC